MELPGRLRGGSRSPGPGSGQEHGVQGHRGYAVAGGPVSPSCAGSAFISLANEEGPTLGRSSAQLHVADGVDLGIWEGPSTRQMAPGILGFYGRSSGKLSGLRCPFFFLKAFLSLDRQYNVVVMVSVCYLLCDWGKFLSLSLRVLIGKTMIHGSYTS